MDQDRIAREIKTILYFSDDITCENNTVFMSSAITLDDIEKRLVECGIIQFEEVSRLKQLIIREFRVFVTSVFITCRNNCSCCVKCRLITLLRNYRNVTSFCLF